MDYLAWLFVILLIGSTTTITISKRNTRHDYSIATKEIVHYIIEEILPNIDNRQRILEEDFDFIERQVNKEIERKLKERGK